MVILSRASMQIFVHSDLLSEEFVVGSVLSIPSSRRVKIGPEKYRIEVLRKSDSGVLKIVTIDFERSELEVQASDNSLIDIQYEVSSVIVGSSHLRPKR